MCCKKPEYEKMARDYDQGDQRAGKDGLLEDRQAHVFAPWRQTY